MNFREGEAGSAREARLKYLQTDFQVLQEGHFVRCAVTGEAIPLDDLRYWDVDRQVPYRSAREAFAVLLGNAAT